MSTWTECRIRLPKEAQEALAHALNEAGANGLVIEDAQDFGRAEWLRKYEELYHYKPSEDAYPGEGVILKAYFPLNQDVHEKQKLVYIAIEQLGQRGLLIRPEDITWTDVNEQDWADAWKTYYKPVRISKRVTIVPTWESYTPQSDQEQIIKLDPGMAFGTGTHPTTALCIQALEAYIQPEDKVIDVGCGSGIISIAAEKLGAGQVLGLDNDLVACHVSEENVQLNSGTERIEIKQNNLLQGIDLKVDLIVANILADVIISFVHEANKCLRIGGLFITSGIIVQKQEEVSKALITGGFTISKRLTQENWVVFVARKVR